jgi:putative ABC transport system substrate-binding protein
VIVATRTPAIYAAAQATKTIPIVMVGSGDPVAEGIVASLARPGGNVTGLAMLGPELNGKRLELLKETFPKVSRVALLRGPETRLHILKDIETAARSLRLGLLPVIVGSAPELKRDFETATKGRAQAILILSQPFTTEHRTQVLELAAKNRLPAMYERNDFVEAGGLMSYGVNLVDLYRRAAIYVDKILRGTKPADLPVEQPMRFEFIINLKAAKQIGLTIPPNVLVRADKVIR